MSPAVGYSKRTFTGPRLWETVEATPFNEVPDCSRGEIRLTAEVALAYFNGQLLPTFALDRAVQILKVLAA